MSTPSSFPTRTVPTVGDFFFFPRELRNEVYKHLWRATPRIRIWNKDMQTYVVSFDSPLPSRARISMVAEELKLPLWLFANKTVLEEAFTEFERFCTTPLLMFGRHCK